MEVIDMDQWLDFCNFLENQYCIKLEIVDVEEKVAETKYYKWNYRKVYFEFSLTEIPDIDKETCIVVKNQYMKISNGKQVFFNGFLSSEDHDFYNQMINRIIKVIKNNEGGICGSYIGQDHKIYIKKEVDLSGYRFNNIVNYFEDQAFDHFIKTGEVKEIWK